MHLVLLVIGPGRGAARKGPLSLFLFPRGVARIARGPAFGLERGFACFSLFPLARELGCCCCGGLLLEALLLGLGGLARLLGLGARDGLSLALGLSLLDRGI